jgi:hypothetical protein
MPVTYRLTCFGQHWVAGRPTLTGGVPALGGMQHVSLSDSSMNSEMPVLSSWPIA